MLSRRLGACCLSMLDLILVTLAVTPSGALSPGPLTTAAVALGVRGGGWRTGFKVALGHMLAELPFVALLCVAYQKIEYMLRGPLGEVMNILAFMFIVYFAALLLRDAYKGAGGEASTGFGRNPIVVGAALTGLNAFFLLWWVTVGLAIIRSVVEAGITGFMVMYASHVWIDYAWLALLAEAGSRSVMITGGKGYRILLTALAVILVVLGLRMIL